MSRSGEVIWQIELPYFVKDKPNKRKAIFAHYGPILAGGRVEDGTKPLAVTLLQLAVDKVADPVCHISSMMSNPHSPAGLRAGHREMAPKSGAPCNAR